jgi:hypothetical protein
MAQEPLQIGGLVEILPAERPVGQPAPPRPYGQVVTVEAEDDRATVHVADRRDPLPGLLRRLRRVDR